MNDEPKWDNEPKFDQMKRHFTLIPIDENGEKQRYIQNSLTRILWELFQ